MNTNILNTLQELTKYEFAGDMEKLENVVINASFTDFQEVISGADSFYHNGCELLIYNTKKGTMSGHCVELFDKFWIDTLYSNKGLEYIAPINYSDAFILCAFDIQELKEKYNNKYMYYLDDIYNKYGLDTTNQAREIFGF